MASTFEENLPLSSFEDIHEYPVATATHKAVEVYERMIVSYCAYYRRACIKRLVQREDPDNPPDLVIAGELEQPDGFVILC